MPFEPSVVSLIPRPSPPLFSSLFFLHTASDQKLEERKARGRPGNEAMCSTDSNHVYLFSMSRVHKARVRVCNFETGQNLLAMLKIVTHTVHAA